VTTRQAGSPLYRAKAALGGPGRAYRGQLRYRCPVVPHHRLALTVTEGRDGRVLIYCHGGCATGDVLRALGLSFADLYPTR